MAKLDYEGLTDRQRRKRFPMAIRLAVYGSLIAILAWIVVMVIIPLTIHQY